MKDCYVRKLDIIEEVMSTKSDAKDYPYTDHFDARDDYMMGWNDAYKNCKGAIENMTPVFSVIDITQVKSILDLCNKQRTHDECEAYRKEGAVQALEYLIEIAELDKN
jgi:hypothetical protein